MSASSFHRHFRAVTSMTPIQFQKQIRLREAARGSSPPGDIAGSDTVGYESPRSSAASTGRRSVYHRAETSCG